MVDKEPKKPAPKSEIDGRQRARGGEGDYESARRFQKEQHRFAKEGPVDAKAQEAARSMTGPEGAELESARRETAKGSPRRKK